MGDVLEAFVDRYSPSELEVLDQIIGDLVPMPREGPRFRPADIGEALTEHALDPQPHLPTKNG